MHTPTPTQRLNCMTLAALDLLQSDYIKNYRGSMVAVILDMPQEFPTLAKFRGQAYSPELRAELQNTFGFTKFDSPDWLSYARAKHDIEDYARRQPPSLWERFKTKFSGIEMGMDP